MLHKHKIAHGNRLLFIYICCRTALGQLQCHLNVFQLYSNNHSNGSVAVRVYVKQMYVNTTCFHMRFYVYATQQSFRQGKKSSNLKTCKSIKLQNIHVYKDSL